jgi:hypothetical protein
MSYLFFGLCAALLLGAVLMALKGSSNSNAGSTVSKPVFTETDAPPVSDFLEVVGESNYQTALESLAGPKSGGGVNVACLATLVPEPSNPHDRNAIRIEISGQTVGYLSRSSAKQFRAAMQTLGRPVAPTPCHATIRGGWKRKSGEGHFGVFLDDFVESD